jgi:WD40 repeat protein
MADVQYIVVTGWNRKVTAFRDFPDQYHVYPTTVLPLRGQEDVWHKDDILTMAFCPPNTIATGSYDGIIIVTNIQSGYILHVFNPFEYEVEPSINLSIDKALFLSTRIRSKEAASLITSGSDGLLRFWNTQKGRLLWKTDATNGRKEGIYCLLTDDLNHRLFTADAAGWVSVWDIRKICVTDDMPKILPLITEFRAHAKPIAAMVWMELSEMILTSSTDCTVRINTVGFLRIDSFFTEKY